MILTVTLNTSIDRVYIVENFKIGEVKRVKRAEYYAGGKGLNVAKVVAALGEDVLATGYIGGFAGKFIEQELDRKGINHNFVRVPGETRSCINIIDEKTLIHTELLEPGFEITRTDIENFLRLYKSLIEQTDVIVLSGSAPRGVNEDIYAELINIANEVKKKVILDTSAQLLINGIKARPTIAKPNLSEVEYILGRKIENLYAAKAAVKTLAEMGAKIAVISMGENGVVAFDKENGYLCHAVPPNIIPINTVGCGDALAAALSIALCRNYDFQQMIKLGVAVSAASALSKETGGCDVEAVKQLFEEVKIYHEKTF